jgi:hypothetical protein
VLLILLFGLTLAVVGWRIGKGGGRQEQASCGNG